MHYIAIDIEKAGKRLDDAILAIGICIGDDKGTVYEKKLWCLKMPEGKDFEKRCYSEFWTKNMDVLNLIKSQEQDIAEVMKEFAEFIDGLEERFHRYTFVSDNPAFDIGHLDYYLQTYADRSPLRYTKQGQYRKISDPSEQINMLINKENIYNKIDKMITHDHNPMNDAEYIYRMQIETNKYMQLNWYQLLFVQLKQLCGY